MHLSEELENLLDQCRDIVEKFIEEHGSFNLFAMVLQSDGEVICVASEQFTETRDALHGVLGVLVPLAAEGKIIASVVCAPVTTGSITDGRSAVMFDMEQKNGVRTYGILPYQKNDYGHWRFGPMEYVPGKKQLFGRYGGHQRSEPQ